ncbi:MAG: type II secretion system protein GspJ [Verrucomicrobiota bacterium]|nr:type II secretion system protein GspJ [Verrucomicrobiota bacterium]
MMKLPLANLRLSVSDGRWPLGRPDASLAFRPIGKRQGSTGDAFTLLELILAVAVAAIVLAAVSAAFFTALHLQESTQDAVDAATPVDQALAVLRRDLECAVTPTNGTDKILSGDFRVGNLTSQGISRPVAIEMFTATGALSSDPSRPWGDIQRVTYELQTPSDRTAQGLDLVRSVTRNLLSTATPDVEDQWLLGGVQSIQFSCFDGTQWLDTWDTSDPTSSETNLPTAVRVEIQLAGNSASPIEMLVPIDSQSLSNATVSGSASVSGGVTGGLP